MKNLILILALLIAFPMNISAKKMTKEEEKAFDTVAITLTDGTTRHGVVKKYWTAYIGKGYNQEVLITLDNGEETKYTIENIDSIVFPLRADTLLKVWRVYNVGSPKLTKSGNVSRWIAASWTKSPHAQIIVPNVRVNILYGTRTEWVTTTNACLKLATDSVAVPFFFNNAGGFNLKFLKSYLKERNPDLFTFIEQWFKADKKRKKDVEKNYALMLDAVEEYYNSKK